MAIQDEQGGNQTAMGAAFVRAGASAAPAPASSGGSGGGSQQPPRSAPTGGGASPQPARPAAFSFRSLSIPMPMGRTPASEVLTKLEKALRAQYENINNQFDIDLIPLDWNQNTSLSVSVLIVCVRLKNASQVGVAFHTLIIEGSVDAPAPRFVPINNQNVEVLVTMGEAYNDKMRAIVEEAVHAQFPQLRPWSADAEVVPRDFDVNNENLVWSLAANAALACSTELDAKRQDNTDLNLAGWTREEQLQVRVAFPKNQVLNAVGQPVRQDLTVDLQSLPPGGAGQQQQMERTATVARISGYLDLIYAPANPPTNQYNPYPQQQQPGMVQNEFQRYIPRVVLTGMESTQAPTLNCQLLTLVMAGALAENNMWVQGFKPTAYAGRTDIHDIGAVGYEANFERNPNGIGARIVTKEDAFKPGDLGRLVAAVMKQALVISLDVEEVGPSTWINGIFAAAATGNPDANRAILAAASQLTNGAFDRHFPPNGRVCVHEDNRIHMGYYFDDDVKRDIRDIDYLAVLNVLGADRPNLVQDWADTFQQTQYPLEQRLAARKRIITSVAPSAQFTGFAVRVTFEAPFIQALIMGCQECGLDVKTVAPFADTGTYDRATYQLAGQTMLQMPNTGLFNRGGYQTAGSVGTTRSFGSGRWF